MGWDRGLSSSRVRGGGAHRRIKVCTFLEININCLNKFALDILIDIIIINQNIDLCTIKPIANVWIIAVQCTFPGIHQRCLSL